VPKKTILSVIVIFIKLNSTLISINEVRFFLNSFNKKSQTNNNKFDCTRLTPEEVYIATSIPKMTSFHDEFSSHKSQRNKSLLIENELIKLKPAEEAESVSPVPTSDLDAPTSWLSLKVIACGMRKYAQLPIPAVNFFIDKGDFGDDAGFWAETKEGCSCGEL
jgi:hypothetical protein